MTGKNYGSKLNVCVLLREKGEGTFRPSSLKIEKRGDSETSCFGSALLKKKLDLSMAYESLGTVYQLPITFIPETEELAKQTYKVASQNGMTYYDASFIALAQQENATLVTENIKHQGKQQRVKVTSLQDY